MMTRMIPIAAIAALLMVGCEKSPSGSAAAVDEARSDAAANTSSAREDATAKSVKADTKVATATQDYVETRGEAAAKLSKVESEAMITKAKADLEVATALADGRHSVALEKCEVLDGAQKNACVSAADAAHALERSEAIALRDKALLRAEQHR
jgi:hypothetical protein